MRLQGKGGHRLQVRPRVHLRPPLRLRRMRLRLERALTDDAGTA